MGHWLAIVALGMAPELAAEERPPPAEPSPPHHAALQLRLFREPMRPTSELSDALPPAQAQPAPQRPPAQTQSAPQPPSTQPQPAPPPEDFDLLEPAPKPDAATLARHEQIARDLSRRRTLLRYHQIGGFATLASMTVAVALGQLNYLDKYGGGGDTGKFATPHRIAAYTAAGIFVATGLLAVLAPNPIDKPLRLDTATLHKAAMAVATAGLATQIVLGIVTAHREGSLSQRDFALAHQIVGYTTLAATAAGFFVLTF